MRRGIIAKKGNHSTVKLIQHNVCCWYCFHVWDTLTVWIQFKKRKQQQTHQWVRIKLTWEKSHNCIKNSTQWSLWILLSSLIHTYPLHSFNKRKQQQTSHLGWIACRARKQTIENKIYHNVRRGSLLLRLHLIYTYAFAKWMPGKERKVTRMEENFILLQ